MRPFEYARPRTAAEAAALLTEPGAGAAILAGGTDLLALMKDEVETPARLVSLAGVEELGGIEPVAEGGVRIGAGVTLAELAADPGVRRSYPALSWAAGYAAGPQIRNLGTLGGNLCQRPRCWYYRRGFGLVPRMDGRSMIRAGDNRYHAILGNDGDALFVSPSTLVPVLSVLGARIALQGAAGIREVPLADFYRIPTAAGEREIDLRPGEIVTAVFLPPAPAGQRVASYEVRPGKSLDWSLATAAVSLAMDGDRVRDAWVVLGQVAPMPWPAEAAAAALAGQRLTPEVMARAAEAAVAGARPLSHNRYKIQLARVAVRRALERAGAGAAGAGREG